MAALLVYSALLLLGVLSTLTRWRQMRGAGMTIPRLLRRDVIVIGGHALPLLLLMAGRVADLYEFDFSGNAINTSPMGWLLIAVPAICAVAVYDYYEWFVIGR